MMGRSWGHTPVAHISTWEVGYVVVQLSNAPIGSDIWTFGPQLGVLFGHGTFRRWSLPEEVDCRDGPKDSCPIPLPDLTWNKQIHTLAALKRHAFSCASPPWTASLPTVNQINPSDLRMFLLGVLSQPCNEQLMQLSGSYYVHSC